MILIGEILNDLKSMSCSETVRTVRNKTLNMELHTACVSEYGQNRISYRGINHLLQLYVINVKKRIIRLTFEV